MFLTQSEGGYLEAVLCIGIAVKFSTRGLGCGCRGEVEARYQSAWGTLGFQDMQRNEQEGEMGKRARVFALRVGDGVGKRSEVQSLQPMSWG